MKFCTAGGPGIIDQPDNDELNKAEPLNNLTYISCKTL